MNIDTYLSDPTHYSCHLLQLAEKWRRSQSMVGEDGMVFIQDDEVLGWDTYQDGTTNTPAQSHWPTDSFAVSSCGTISLLSGTRMVGGTARLFMDTLPISMEMVTEEDKPQFMQSYPNLLHAVRVVFRVRTELCTSKREFFVLFHDDLTLDLVREVRRLVHARVVKRIEDIAAKKFVECDPTDAMYAWLDLDWYAIGAAKSFYGKRGLLVDILNRHRPNRRAAFRDSAQRLWRRIKHRVILKRFSKEVCPAHIGNVEP